MISIADKRIIDQECSLLENYWLTNDIVEGIDPDQAREILSMRQSTTDPAAYISINADIYSIDAVEQLCSSLRNFGTVSCAEPRFSKNSMVGCSIRLAPLMTHADQGMATRMNTYMHLVAKISNAMIDICNRDTLVVDVKYDSSKL